MIMVAAVMLFVYNSGWLEPKSALSSSTTSTTMKSEQIVNNKDNLVAEPGIDVKNPNRSGHKSPHSFTLTRVRSFFKSL